MPRWLMRRVLSKEKSRVLCQQPSTATLKEARAAFAGTVAAWSMVEIIRFGPVTQEHRFERLFFWPDPKGLGLKQIQDALAKQGMMVTEPDELAGKSVALQGLPAIEYLLYGNGADALAAESNVEDGKEPLPDLDSQAAFRCAFASSIATNIDRMAKAVVEGWREGSAYEKAFLGSTPEDPYYHSPKEVTLDLFKTFSTGIELVRDQKLGKPLGANPAEAKPKLAAFWRSGLTFDNAAGNLEGAKAIFAQGGFAQVVASDLPGVENSTLFDLDHAIEVLHGIDQPTSEVVKNDDLRAKIEALRVRTEKCCPDRRRHHLARRRSRFRLQCHGWRLAMSLDRRSFLLSLASSAAMLALPAGATAAPDAECFAAARRDDRGNFSAALFTLDGDVRAVELPQRGHDITLKPDGREWVAFARRPGRFGVAIPLDARPPVWFAAKSDRHFFGHGVFSGDGRLLYTTENDYGRAAGVIGVRDATAGYKQIGEFSAHGLEPHDIALLADGRTMVIANGGIQTHPDRGDDELNIPDMQPSLVYVDLATGDLLEEQRLAPALHQLSIRHLAIAAGGTVVFGCQYRGPEENAPALVGFHRRGETPVIVEAPAETQIGLRNYVGSVAADSAGVIVAASAPKGGLVAYWDVAGRRFLGVSNLNDGCGLAPTHRSAHFLLTSGEGWLATADPDGDMARQSSGFQWDNHAILVR